MTAAERYRIVTSTCHPARILLMQEKLETRTFLLFLFAVSIGFALLIKPFFGTIFLACAISGIFAPPEEGLL